MLAEDEQISHSLSFSDLKNIARNDVIKGPNEGQGGPPPLVGFQNSSGVTATGVLSGGSIIK